jgi:hypothetical protein
MDLFKVDCGRSLCCSLDIANSANHDIEATERQTAEPLASFHSLQKLVVF